VIAPHRGEVWLVDLNPTRGHEQAGKRPALVVSEDIFNEGPADLCIVIPITSKLRQIPSQVRIPRLEGGLERDSAALCEAVRSISRSRFVRKLGAIRRERMRIVEDALRILMAL
jgi:mRNA interferase MazF